MAQVTTGHFATPAPVKGTGSRNYFRFGEWKIGHLLPAFFAAIVLLMIVGDAIAVLQFNRIETRARRFYEADQKSLAIMHVYLDVVTFRDTLTGLAHDQNAHEFGLRATALRDNFLRDVTRAQQTLSSAPDVNQDPAILIRLETVRAALPLQVDSLLELVKVEDWQAVRFRLAGQEHVLIALSASLVADVEQEVAQDHTLALEGVQRTRRQLYLVLSITALLILLIAAVLGWYATRRISRSLAKLDAGAQALARGEFGYEIELSGNDELADLARAFNCAAQQLQELYDGIKRGEAYLAESNARLEEAQRITHVGYWEWDPSTDRVNWSDETYRIYGMRPQERPMDLATVQEKIHPEDWKRATEAAASGIPFSVECRLFRPTGEMRIVDFQGDVKRDSSGQPSLRFGTVQDITDRKRAEQRLHESEAYLAEAQRLSQTGSWAWNPATGDIRYWSEMCYRMLGFDPAGPLPRFEEFVHRVHPDDQAGLRERFDRAIRDKADFELDYRVVHPEKRIRDIHVVGHAVLDGSGSLDEFVGTVIDVTERKRAEEALQRSQFYISEGQRLAHMGSWAFNPEGFFDYWSEELFRIYGLDPRTGAPTLERYLATVHPQDRDSMADTIKRMHAEHSGCDVKKRIVRPDGEQRYIRCVGIPVVEGDNLKGFLGTAMDITEQELLTQELERRQAYLAEAQRLTHTGSWAWNVSTDELFWSEEIFRIYEVDPMKAKPAWSVILDRVHPDDRASLEQRKKMESTQTEWAASEADFRIVVSDGKIKHLHSIAHPVMDASGQIIEVIGTVMDVTEWKRVEDSLRLSESHLAEAQKLTHTCSWAWRLADRKIVHLSEEWYRIYRFDPAEGAPTWEEYLKRVHPEDRPKWKDMFERAIVEKAHYDQEFRILLPNGMVKWIHTVGHPVLSDAGDLEQFVGSSTDITERKCAEQEREKLRQLEADLAHINRVSTLGEMAASLAHEIKQPIAAAITSANSCMEWLAHDPPNLDRARTAAARIDKYGNRAAEIIDRIRSFYRKSPSKRELVNVNGIVQEMLTLLNGEANRYSVAMRTDLSAELPQIMADRVQLQQVFMNLILNAIEAMKDSGGELTVKSQLQDGQLQFSVSDTGVGLPTEKMDQIFSAFFTTKPQGSGMGLAISRSIVESHGGQLWASPNRGGGATFHFTLPTEVTEPTPLVA